MIPLLFLPFLRAIRILLYVSCNYVVLYLSSSCQHHSTLALTNYITIVCVPAYRFLNSNRRPCDEMLELLDEYFSPSAVKVLSEESEDDDEDDNEDEGENGVPTSRATKHSYSLAIVSGTDGARLTHSHRRQWHFVRQSLLLWRAITHDMFRLWSLAEQDMFNSSYNSSQQQDGGGAGGGGSGGGAPYVLKDTGQGIQRVQPCPRTYRAMQVVHCIFSVPMLEWRRCYYFFLKKASVFLCHCCRYWLFDACQHKK